MMTSNLFVIANVKQLRTGGSFRILLPFFRTSWGVGVLNSTIFNSFHNRVEFGTILEGLRNFGGGGLETPHPPSVRHCSVTIAGLWVWALGLLNTRHDFWPIDCDHWFVGLRVELLMNVKSCYWLKIVRFPFSDIQSLYKFSVLVSYCAEFMVYPSGF